MSTNNQLSGHRQEDVKRVPSVPHDKQKIQGAEKYAMDHAHDDFYKNFKPDQEVVKKMKNKQDVNDILLEHEVSCVKREQLIKKLVPATEQVALLTRVLGLIEDEKLYSNEQLHGHNNNNLKTRNKLRAVFRDKVQAILKEYEV